MGKPVITRKRQERGYFSGSSRKLDDIISAETLNQEESNMKIMVPKHPYYVPLYYSYKNEVFLDIALNCTKIGCL